MWGPLTEPDDVVVCWNGERCRWHRVGVCRFWHDSKPPVLQEMDMVRKLAARVMWLSVFFFAMEKCACPGFAVRGARGGPSC